MYLFRNITAVAPDTTTTSKNNTLPQAQRPNQPGHEETRRMPNINTSTNAATNATTQPANLTGAQPAAQPTPATLGEMYTAYSKDGWTARALTTYISGVIKSGNVQPHLNPLWKAVLSPSMPKESHKDDKFFEVLAWYVDKSTSQSGDGRLSLKEVQESLEKYGQQYLQLSTNPEQSVHRLQAWKFVQKLRLLEKEINVRIGQGKGAYYPYSPRAMMEIDQNSDFNRTNTVRSRADFSEKVLAASYDKPVLVKFGLTYCAHCLLLEQLGSVPAVAEKYADEMEVFKLWWNPPDEAYKDLNDIAGEPGVNSSPMFILFKDGKAVKSGYAFPDETGGGMESFLEGHIA